MKLLNSYRSLYSIALSVVLSVVLVALSASATTISTNINTSGTLGVTSLSTFTGGFNATASSTVGSTLNIGALGYLGASSTAGFTGLSTHVGGLLSQASSTFASGKLTVSDYFAASSTSGFTGLSTFAGGFNATASSTVGSTLNIGALGYLGASSTAGFTGSVFGYASSTFSGSFTVGDATTTDILLLQASLHSSSSAVFDTVVVGPAGNKVNEMLHGTCSVNFGSVSTTTEALTTCAATGVTTSHRVFITPNFQAPDQYVVLQSASSSAADTIQLVAILASSTSPFQGVPATVNPAAYTWSWMAIR